jgi:CPA2 family monovalent cation:H+ antiporter-2
MNAVAYFIPAILVLIAALGGAIALKLHRPLIIGYALAGIVLAFLVPPSSLANLHTLKTLAQIEAVVLMFWAGMELRFRPIVELKWIAIAIGILGTLFSIVLGLGAAYWLRWPAAQGLALGAATSLSSTIVLSRLMTTEGESQSRLGMIMLGLNAIDTLPIARFALPLGKGALILAAVILLTVKVLPRRGARAGRSRDQGLHVIGAIAAGFATAALTQAIGLLLPLSAFVGGIVASSFESGQEAAARLLPLKCMPGFVPGNDWHPR